MDVGSVTRDQCLRRIEKVLAYHESPDSAYPVRLRLRRASHSIAMWVADGGDSPRADVGIGALAQALERISARICQPSEPLHERWRLEWAEAMAVVREIREALLREN